MAYVSSVVWKNFSVLPKTAPSAFGSQQSAPPLAAQAAGLIVGETFEHGEVGCKTPPYMNMKPSCHVGGHFICPLFFAIRLSAFSLQLSARDPRNLSRRTQR